jgi:hypothetical protein
MRELAVSRLILIIMCGSYLLSAGLLTWARLAGQTVPGWKIGGWVVTGIIGLGLIPYLATNRPIISLAMLVVLAPWMALALVDDTRSAHYIIAVVDLAGLIAIGYALWLIKPQTI